MKRTSLIAVLCLLCNTVFAAPVYLDCSTTSQTGAQSLFSLSVNEETMEVVKTMKTGLKADESTRFVGIFAPNTISFEKYWDEGPREKMKRIWDEYVINRTDLTIIHGGKFEVVNWQVGSSGALIDSGTFKNAGSCAIVDMKKRKI